MKKRLSTEKMRKRMAMALLLGTGLTLTTPFIEYTLGQSLQEEQLEKVNEQEEIATGEVLDADPNDKESFPDIIDVPGAGSEEEPEVLQKVEEVEENTTETPVKKSNQRMMTFSMVAESEPVYEVAKDEDFVFVENSAAGYIVNGKKGNFQYRGTDDYVEIPATIHGHVLTNYMRLFSHAPETLKGVKSTNPNIRGVHAMFTGSTNPTLDLSQFDTSNMTDLGYMFESSFTKEVNFGNMDTSKVVVFSRMFQNSYIEKLDLSNFDTSKAHQMDYMFHNSKATEIDVSSFNTSTVMYMNNMFSYTKAKTLDVSGFDTTNVNNMSSMFEGSVAEELDLSNFKTGKTVYMMSMFRNASAKKINLTNWDTRNVIKMESMFEGINVPELNLSSLKTPKVTIMSRMFSGATIPNLDLRSFDTSGVTTMSSMFRDFKGTVANLSSFNTSKVENMSSMFRDSNISHLDLRMFNTSNTISMDGMFQGAKATSIDVSSFNTMRITNMKDMFNGALATDINLGSFDTSYVTNMQNMFKGTRTSKLDLSSFDMGSVNNTDGMLEGITTKVGVTRSKGDADKLNASKGKPQTLVFTTKYALAKDEDFIGTINGNFKYVGDDEYVEVPHTIRGVNVTSYKDMFANTSVKGVISTNPKVTDMSNMFMGNTSTDLEVGTINTESVTNMSGMFQGTKATTLDLRNFVTSNVVNMGQLFKDSKVSELDLGGFDLTKVTNTTNMFSGTVASKGYARTSGDMTKLVNSTGKPAGLSFSIWSITAEQNTNQWTNGSVEISLKANSDTNGVAFVEMVNEPGRNLLVNSHREVGVGGKSEFVMYADLAPIFDKYGTEQTYSLSFDLKSQDTSKRNITNVYMQNGSSTKYSFVSKGLVVREEYQRYEIEGLTPSIASASETRAMLAFYGNYGTGNYSIIKNVKVELGDEATPWTPAPEDKAGTGVSGDVFDVYDNGTYIFRVTDNKGNNRTVAHKVTNIDKVEPKATVTKGTTGWTSQDVELTIDATDDASGVKSITLPDGKVVNGSKATYKATENKTYSFKVTDNAGNIKTVTDTVSNIDRSVPVLTAVADNQQWTKDPININVTTAQSASGLTDVQMVKSPSLGMNKLRYADFKGNIGDSIPEGWNDGKASLNMEGIVAEIVQSPWEKDGKAYHIKVNENRNFLGRNDRMKVTPGTEITTSIYSKTNTVTTWYNFQDANGNEIERNSEKKFKHYKDDIYYYTLKVPENAVTYQIMRLGIGTPHVRTGEDTFARLKVEEGKEPTPWTPAPEDVSLSSTGKKYPIVANGMYTFKATYNNGLTSETSVNITNIDRTAPEITIKGNPENYTEDDTVTLEVTVKDTQSGMSGLTLPNGTTTTNTTATVKVTENGDYTFTAVDKLGNKTTHTEKVDKIMVPYKFYIYDNNGKPFKGVGYELLRDGNVHATAESDVNGLVDFGKVPLSGKYSIRQVKVPGGGAVNPGEQEVEVGDTTEPEEFISYPRGQELPATGTLENIRYLVLLTGVTTLTWVTRKRIKNRK